MRRQKCSAALAPGLRRVAAGSTGFECAPIWSILPAPRRSSLLVRNCLARRCWWLLGILAVAAACDAGNAASPALTGENAADGPPALATPPSASQDRKSVV